MAKTKGAKNKIVTIFALYDKEECCVCVGTAEECAAFAGGSKNNLYSAFCNKRRFKAKYKVYKVGKEKRRMQSE